MWCGIIEERTYKLGTTKEDKMNKSNDQEYLQDTVGFEPQLRINHNWIKERYDDIMEK